jgi:hypothetical protein
VQYFSLEARLRIDAGLRFKRSKICAAPPPNPGGVFQFASCCGDFLVYTTTTTGVVINRRRSVRLYREAQLRRGHIARSVTENQAALQVARQRYSEGAIDFLNVITTQAQLLQSENDLADSDTQIATNLVNLYRAIGGGWEVADVAYRADRAKIGAR